MTRLSWDERRGNELKSACERTGKRRFRTQEQAERVIALSAGRLADGDVARQEQRAYECAGDRACGGWHVSSKPRHTPPQAPLPAQSPKRKIAQSVRSKMLKDLFGDERPTCAVPYCWQWADDAHEPLTRARGGSITDPNNVVAICRAHHDSLTFMPDSELGWAYELGLLAHSWDKTADDGVA